MLAAALVLAACQPGGGPSTATTGGATAPTANPNVKTIVPVQPGPAMPGEVKIGFISSMTGALNDSSTANMRGFELAVEDWNNAGGFGGKKVVPVIYDDELRPQRAVDHFVRWSYQGLDQAMKPFFYPDFNGYRTNYLSALGNSPAAERL